MLEERLLLLRNEKGLTQEDIADIVNVSRQTYATFEKGANVGSDVLLKLAKYYAVSLDYLVGITDIRENIYYDPKVAEYINDCLIIYKKHIAKKDKV